MVTEQAGAGDVPHVVHPGWRDARPWLAQGTTLRADDNGAWDAGLFGDTATGTSLGRWRRLRDHAGAARAVHGRQVHAAEVAVHDEGLPGVVVLDAVDGHATAAAGVLLTVSVADCVPVFLLDPERRALGLLHAGWRGTAAGVLEAGLGAMAALGARTHRLEVHLGPAICGRCYEVGPDVPDALGLDHDGRQGHVDLRAALAHRAVAAGVSPGSITVSTLCTRCHNDRLFSHRAGDTGRLLAFMGLRSGNG